jgi:hypothetical protein
VFLAIIGRAAKQKVVPGIEPRLPESESDVLTITLYNHDGKLQIIIDSPKPNSDPELPGTKHPQPSTLNHCAGLRLSAAVRRIRKKTKKKKLKLWVRDHRSNEIDVLIQAQDFPDFHHK